MSTKAQKEARTVTPLEVEQAKLATYLAQEQVMLDLEKVVWKEREVLPNTPNERLAAREAGLTREEERRIRSCTDLTLKQLRYGVDMRVGVAHTFMEALDGKPGLIELRQRIVRARNKVAKLQAEEDRWANGPRSMRFVGKPGKCMVDTPEGKRRYLEPGDVVLVTRHRATALFDMFEDVELPKAEVSTEVG